MVFVWNNVFDMFGTNFSLVVSEISKRYGETSYLYTIYFRSELMTLFNRASSSDLCRTELSVPFTLYHLINNEDRWLTCFQITEDYFLGSLFTFDILHSFLFGVYFNSTTILK